jgi:hypothetical protein
MKNPPTDHNPIYPTLFYLGKSILRAANISIAQNNGINSQFISDLDRFSNLIPTGWKMAHLLGYSSMDCQTLNILF